MGNLTLEDVNNMYLDVLKEIGNIGAGNATTAIANMLGMKIDMNVPNVKLMEVSKLGTAVGAEDETIVGIFLEVMNDIEGSMMFLVDIFWVVWLLFCIRESKTKAERVIYGCFVVVGVVLFGMNLYGWWTIRR